MIIITPNKINQARLEAVKAEMLILGAPTIRVIGNGEICWAVEGSHRLVAAYEMEIEPEIIVIEYSDEKITIQWDGSDKEFAISELADMLVERSSRYNHILEFR